MKIKAIIIATLSLVAINAHANEITVLECKPAVPRPDMGFSVEVTTDMKSKNDTLTITHFFLGHREVKDYAVREILPQRGRAGAPVVYKGRGVELSVNFTTAPVARGHRGTLTVTDRDGSNTDDVVCQRTR